MSGAHAEGQEAKQPFREMTVGDLIAELKKYPAHHYVSPFVNNMLGAGLAVWQMTAPETNEPIVAFGEKRAGMKRRSLPGSPS